MLFVRASGQVQSRDPVDWAAEHRRSCVLALLGTDLNAKPSVFLLSVCVSVSVCLCVYEGVNLRDASPAQNSSA